MNILILDNTLRERQTVCDKAGFWKLINREYFFLI